MKKQIPALLLALLCAALLATAAMAEDDEAADYTYTVNANGNAVITGYTGSAVELIIPSTIDGHNVTEIGERAFDRNTQLKTVVFPDTVTVIGKNAFRSCTGLTEITLPKSLTTVKADSDSGPFAYCNSLTKVTFEEGITRIPNYILSNCEGRLEMLLPDTVTEIGTYAFCNSGIISVKIPDTVTAIGSRAFNYCSGLTELRLPSRLTYIGGLAFGNCTGLTEITIPKRLTDSEQELYTYFGPFGRCDNLSTVTFELGMKKIPPNILNGCTGKFEAVLPDTVTEIGIGAFHNSGLCSIELPEKLSVIGQAAFSGCAGLKNIALPDSLTTIGLWAFEDCTALSAVTLPDSVTSIGKYVFRGCTSLTDVKLPEGLKAIPDYAFQNCTALEAIALPDTVTAIKSTAFKGCTSLKEIPLSKSLTAVEDSAFADCSALPELAIPDTVTSVGASAFSNCDSLTSVTVPDSVTSLGTGVFYDCDELTTVNLGTGITSIPTSTFNHCDALETLTVPRRVTSIGANAFKDCVSFTSICIPRSVTSIDASAFSYPAKLTIYGVPGTYAETFANENDIKFVAREVNAESAALDRTELRLLKGASTRLALTVSPEDFTDAVTWKSANTSVATVSDDGTVKAVGVGNTTIKVTVGSVTASCKVTVVQPVTSISLSRTAVSLEALETSRLTATVSPSSAEDKRVQWLSSAPDIASVSEDGLVTALKKGTAVITASAMDGSGVSRSCTVTVSSTAHICATAAELESPHNYENSCTDSWVYTVPGATELNVAFDERTCIEDEFDFLYIYDAAGNEVGKYTGTALAGKTVTVPGDTVKIKLVSDDSGSEWGFRVTAVT